ncbi:MAG: beta strand repeat-containing protein, partial [Methanobrevibacter sp.]
MEKSKKFLLIVLTISLILLIGIPSTFATSVDNNTIISSNRDNGSISTNTIDNNSYYNQNSINGASEDVSNKIVEDNSGSNFFTKESINDNKSLISDNEGSIVYVNGTSGDDTNTGSSWNSSFKTLQYALTVVKNSNGTINTIYIAPGSYAEGKFNLTSNVTFTGFGDVYIDGLNKTDLFAIAANNVTAIFNNIKFINSNATTFNGGAISSKSYMTGKIVVNNCSFINNTGSMWVAAIYSSNNLIIENSTFINNVGGFGGAIYCSNETQVINSVFINNTAKGTGYGYNFGGAIRVQGGNVNVTKYIFFGNNASNGSAIELFNSLVKSATINYNIFENYPEGATVIGQSGVKTSINANYNYFGLNSNITKIVGENITADYWTILDLSFLEDEIAAGKDYDLVIDFTKYTDGTNYYTLTEKMPAVNLSLSSKLGSISPNIVNLEDGTSTVKYSALSSGDETITIKDPYHEGTFKFVVSENENNIIHVSVNGSDDTGDGSKDNPYQSIDKAIAMNDALGGNKTIFIFNGTYKSNSQNITKKVIIIGESAGSVIIDGELNDYILNISSDVIVRNIIFKNGKNAIVNNGTLTLNNCSFENNTNIGVYNINEALINGTNFTGNGIAIYSSGNLELYNGVLSNNLNGGMYVENNASIISSEFVNNTALNGGAIWGNNSNIVVNNSIFTSNTASISGGAIYLEDSAAGLNGNIINNCSSPVGNYIYLDNSIVNKLNIIFMDNKTAGFVYDEDTPVLTANVTDDMGNPIGGGFINFYANNESVANVSVVEGLAIYNYTNAKLGLYNISGNYSGVSNPVIKPGKLNVFIRYWYINDTGYATLQDAIANVNNGEVIKGLEGVYAYDSSVL